MDTNDIMDIIKKINNLFPKIYILQLQDDNLKLCAEKDNGYVEYKRKLAGCPEFKAKKYATQMRWRMTQNTKNLQATYYIGVDDDGEIIGIEHNDIIDSITTFISISNSIGASITGIKIIHILNKIILWFGVKHKKLKDNYIVDFNDDKSK